VRSAVANLLDGQTGRGPRLVQLSILLAIVASVATTMLETVPGIDRTLGPLFDRLTA